MNAQHMSKVLSPQMLKQIGGMGSLQSSMKQMGSVRVPLSTREASLCGRLTDVCPPVMLLTVLQEPIINGANR
ncbi:unnamed protein product [Prunus armeniaca]